MPIANRGLLQKVLVHPDTFATTLVVCLVDTYGTEVFDWSPETIRLETEQDFSIQWPQSNFDRLMAGCALVKTDNFYKNLPDFIELCGILSGAPAHPGVFAPADAAECAWGVTETLLLSPPDEAEPFSDEIRAYIGKVVEMEGIISPPDILKIGILSGDYRIRVHNDFSDDPELYGAIWGTEQDKTDDINDLVKGRLTLLIQQLSSLQLTNGDTSKIAKQMLTSLKAHPVGGQPLS